MSHASVLWRGTCYGRSDAFDVDVPEEGVVSGYRKSCQGKFLNYCNSSVRDYQIVCENITHSIIIRYNKTLTYFPNNVRPLI